MGKLLFFVFGIFFCNTVAWAEAVPTNKNVEAPAASQEETAVIEPENTEATENIAADDIKGTENVPTNNIIVNAVINPDTKKPELEIIRQDEVELVDLPECNDERLLKEVREYAKDYFDNVPNLGTLYRRHRHFVLQNLDNFAKENVANYKTAATSPISDIIADTKINKGVAEENLRLCKNQSKEPHAAQVYLLIYPEDNEYYHVRIINLVFRQKLTDDTSFKYLR